MGAFIDLTGINFGRLTVVKRITSDNKKIVLWECKCICGNLKNVRATNLRSGSVSSCGCARTDFLKSRATHGQYRNRLYNIYRNVIRRCYDEKHLSYCKYGALGLSVCDEWKNDMHKFIEWANNNGYSNNLTLDRIDNNKGYSPDNCRWLTYKDQNRNKKSTIYISVNGKKYNMSKFSEDYNIKYGKLYYEIIKKNGSMIVDCGAMSLNITLWPQVVCN